MIVKMAHKKNSRCGIDKNMIEDSSLIKLEDGAASSILGHDMSQVKIKQ